MPDEIRGIAGPDDIRSQEDALRLLDIDESAEVEDVSDAVTEIIPDAHPDTGGTVQLFKAVQLAEDALTGETEILRSGGRAADLTQEETLDISIGGSSGGTQDTDTPDPSGSGPFGGGVGTQDDDVRDGPGSGPGGDFGGFGAQEPGSSGGVGFSGVDAEGLINEVEEILREQIDEEDIKENFGDIANFRNVSEAIAAQILQGNITLGDIENIIGGGDIAGSTEAATGGIFSDNPSGSYVGGGGNPNFGSVGDAQYSPENVGNDDDDED